MATILPYHNQVNLRRRFIHRLRCTSSRYFSSPIRSSLPFASEKARFYKEAEVAVDVVERACRLCVDIKRTLLSDDNRILEKNDLTPVTVADFSVQALISLELKRAFSSIPLVAEEDSSSLTSGSVSSQTDDSDAGNFLVNSVVNAVADKTRNNHEPLTSEEVLNAIDRGGKDAFSFDTRPATYWVLDPIDGTRGFLKGSDALYVVGLALVVEGMIVLGVMGCPNWKENSLSSEDNNNVLAVAEIGIIMVSHIGCGTWTRRFLKHDGNLMGIEDVWSKCFVDSCRLINGASISIPESQTWESMPFSRFFSSTVDNASAEDQNKVILISTCCGRWEEKIAPGRSRVKRSLCKYMMVASGRASAYIQRSKVESVIKVWDHAAGVICVIEAGGRVTDWRGSQLDLAADQIERRIIFPSGGVLVSNGNLHKQLLEMIPSNSSVA